jgi:hypothetical protein
MWTVQEPPSAAGPFLSLGANFNQDGWYDGNDMIAADTSLLYAALIGVTWNITSTAGLTLVGYNMQTGAQDFTSTLQPPTGLPNDWGNTIETTYEFNGLFYIFEKQTMQWAAWDVKKGGQPVWVSQPYTDPWGMYAQAGGEMSAFGLYYAAGFDGEIHAYNVINGNQVFDFHSASAGYNTPYGVYPFYGGITMTADGKIFAQTGQHGNGVEPMYRGEGLYVVNATSGASLWNMTGWFNNGALADGMWVTQNNYDNLIYCFGKGPSATTVTATPGVGNVVTIQGTVTDQSPGAKDTAAIADQYMSTWMEYLYEQQPLPANFPCDTAGVQVTLTAIDPNGIAINIGTATSDIYGHYAFTWTPPSTISGLYTIIASFSGTNSYYGSIGETSISADSAPVAAPISAPASVVSTYFVPAVVAIIIVIIIVGAVLAVLTLRKRP